MSTLLVPMVDDTRPLADRLRPKSLSEVVGQQHLLKPGKPLHRVLTSSSMHSIVFWGPPGCGKTTIARLLAQKENFYFDSLSAVQSGVKELRKVIENAIERKSTDNIHTLLFIDEIHRYNKSQQDALLPYVENGSVVLVGATTENPSFELNNALLSRLRVYALKPIDEDDLTQLLRYALTSERGLANTGLHATEESLLKIATAADGDARQALNLLELCADFSEQNHQTTIDDKVLEAALTEGLRRFDKKGDSFYDQISALHKAVRGSDPDAALYWFARMLDGGCDPLYIARRVLRMATEDIGNADPRALQIALNAWDSQHRLGSPEGELAIAQAIVYLASTEKSNAVYLALQQARQDARQHGSLPVPLHLRNAPTRLMKQMNYGKGYRYAHDEQNGFTPGQRYFPDEMPQRFYYHPVERGLEQKIKARLEQLKAGDAAYSSPGKQRKRQ